MAFTHSAGWQPNFGGVLKSVGEGGVFGALCVRFSSADEPDVQGEWVDEYTEFCMKSAELHVPMLFNHAVPVDSGATAKRFADAVFSDATIERVDNGLFGTIKLSPSDPLESA